MRIYILFSLLLLMVSCQDDRYTGSLPEVVDFNQHIRPILSNNCYTCHGPDISSRKADLRLDQEIYAKTKNENGHWPIKAGSSQKSEIYKRISTDDPEQIMPPPETNRTLSDYEKALIARWIDQGALWKKHWAFIPPTEVANADDHHTIDQIIDKKLTSMDLHRAPLAGSKSLARRLSFILTGLPPDVASLDKNLEDTSIYEAYVDELLASPAYGERWARHWMDLARYAEGRGHEFDYPVIGAWQYRDYLIRAFNQDIPYDDFIREQLAGDLLKTPRINDKEHYNESTIGTVFLNLSEGKHSPVDTKDEEKIRIDNVIDVTTKTFQGLTVACARCHDHKFDDIPTTDYYALYGIFESTRAHLYPTFATAEYGEEIDSIKALKENLKHYLHAISDQAETPEATLISQPSTSELTLDVKVMGDFRQESFDGWTSDGYCFGDRPNTGEVVVKEDHRAAVVREGVASSRKFNMGLSGALRSPTFIIDHDYLLFRAAGRASTIRVVMDNLQLIQDPIHGAFTRRIDSDTLQDYISYVGQWKGNKAYIEIIPGIYYSKNGKNHHYKLDPDAWIEASYVLAMDTMMEKSSSCWWSTNVEKKSPNNEKLPEGIWKVYSEKLTEFQSTFNDTMFYAGSTDGDYIQSAVFIRGDHRNLSEEKVPHRFFTALKDIGPEFPKEGSGRLALAEAIADPSNPLTARVMVNRVWHHLFGRGIVSTVDNFGLQGTLPSHPELLDHLALWFIKHDWSVKQLIKYIVTSETFRQSTEIEDSLALEKDPDDHYLHSFPVQRLEAEAIRDAVLACSGRLDHTMYGPSIPLHLTEFLQGRGRPSISGPLDGGGRRSIYQALWRNFLPPFMTTFDMPIPFSTFGDRSETNVPAQSLTLLNDPFIKEQAEVWAKCILGKKNYDSERIASVYNLAFSRDPSPIEMEQAKAFILAQIIKYDGNNMATEMAWTDFCHSIYNMKEFIYLL
ncbi:MAG: PSD1 domain-containing protein [Saprospiraceae bacterium]|nr:PSD1 domain-containing protein [Saprospiraceae bacterium]